MLQTVSVTSKNQITLPVNVVEYLGLKKGDKLSVKAENSTIIMEKPADILNRIAGSLETPKQLKGKSLDEIIESSKKNYFNKEK